MTEFESLVQALEETLKVLRTYGDLFIVLGDDIKDLKERVAILEETE